MKVIKRNLQEVEYDRNKIEVAILKAMQYGSGIVHEDIAKSIADRAENVLMNRYGDIVAIKDIELYVFNELIRYKQNETARAYESYRTIRAERRKNNTTDKSVIGLIKMENEETMNENSNKSAVLISTQRDLIAGEVSKDIARRKLIPPHIIQAHDEGVLHWHDMDYTIQPCFNCCLINLEDMLDNGTVINEKMVESPKSFSTACTVTTQIMAQVASNQYGGQSITIKHLAKYLSITYDKYYHMFMDMGVSERDSSDLAHNMMLKELKNGIQTIRYQLSTLMTTNGQAPFATIYLEIEVGHKYEKEMALICEEIIKQRLEGMKNEKGQNISEAFPKLVYLLDENNCLEGGKYDYITELACYCTTKRLVPDYQSKKIMYRNYENNSFPPMGCRSHLSPYKDEAGEYKWYGRFNQGVVSLNLPQIGLIAKGDIDLFWELLDKRAELCKEALMCRHNLLRGTKAKVSPVHWQYGAIARLNKDDVIDKYLENGYSTLSLGYVGMYELTQAMFGISHTTEKGKEFALKVIQYLENKCKEWRKESNLGFSLYGTPAESLVYRFCSLDKNKFGIIPNVTDKLYYTNSYHVNVCEKIDAFSKLEFESTFQNHSLGGAISYIEVPDMSKNVSAVKKIVNFIYHHIQYAEINSKPDVCYECGFNGEILCDDNLEWYCPSCGNRDKEQMQVVRRTCGYIGTNFWNLGRTQEIKERVYHL